MPDHLFIVGVQRCGTTSLHRVLDSHPQIQMARPVRPEPKALLSPMDSSTRARYVHDVFGSVEPGVQLLGEKSTSYLDSDVALERIAHFFPHARVLVLVRDPVERAISHFGFSAENGLEERRPEEALLEPERSWDGTGTSVTPYSYLRRSRYVERLDAAAEILGPDAIHVLVQEELFACSDAVQALFRELGVGDAAHVPALALRSNAGRSRPRIPPHVREALVEHLRPSASELERRLGRILPWQTSA